MAQEKAGDLADRDSVARVMGILAPLRTSASGRLLYGQVLAMLEELVAARRDTEAVCGRILEALLGVFLHAVGMTPQLELRLRLLRTRLQPPWDARQCQRMEQGILELMNALELADRQPRADVLEQALGPLFDAYGIVPPGVEKDAGAPAAPATEEAATAPPEAEGDAVEAPAAPVPATARIHRDQPPVSESGAETGSPPEAWNEDLTERLSETISRNQEFGVLLEVVLGELRTARSAEDLDGFRWLLVREVERLLGTHRELAGQLDATFQYLQAIESDSRQLSDELSRVRLLSLTDELTSLPNRRAFLNRLENEVSRVQRYGAPLSLGLIDLDHFKQVNDRYGHAAGDEVLRVFARSVMAVFRHHDVVSRYGGEEFAVLLPNTDQEGAQRALNKVRERCRETRWQINGDTHPMPTFSAGLALYKPGESVDTFIERVDKALYRAKRAGRDRIEWDRTYENETLAAEEVTD